MTSRSSCAPLLIQPFSSSAQCSAGGVTLTQGNFSAQICNSGSAPGQPTKFTATLTGANASPPNDSKGTGSAYIVLAADSKSLAYDLKWSGLSGAPTSAGFYSSSGLVKTIPIASSSSSSGSVMSSWSSTDSSQPLTSSLVSSLKSGSLWIDIATANYPSGEITGDITPLISM